MAQDVVHAKCRGAAPASRACATLGEKTTRSPRKAQGRSTIHLLKIRPILGLTTDTEILQDYSLRAADYNKKKKYLKHLRDKAEDRNEDEFYFGMMSRKGPGSRATDGKHWKGTVSGDRGNKAMDMETVRLLKTQDIAYIRTMRQVTAKKVAKLQEQVVLTRGLDRLDEEDDDEGDDDMDDDDDDMFDLGPSKPKAPRKIVFVDDEDEREDVMEEAEEETDRRAAKAEAEAAKKKTEQAEGDEEEEAEQEKNLRRLRRRLEGEKKRLQALTEAERELEIQKAKMAKTATSGGETRRGQKIKVRTRKR